MEKTFNLDGFKSLLNKTLFCFSKVTLFLVFLLSKNVDCCFEERPDHTMTEPPMKPLLKVGKSCPIPERKTTTLKNAKFITKCQFASINYQTLGDESILLPTGDVLPKESSCYTYLDILWIYFAAEMNIV